MATALHLRVIAPVLRATPIPCGLSGCDPAVRLRDIIGLVQRNVWSLRADFGVENLGFLIVQILSRIGSLVLEHLDEHVES